MRYKRIGLLTVVAAAAAALAACGPAPKPVASPSSSAGAASPSAAVSPSASPQAANGINSGDTLRRQLELITGTVPPPILVIPASDTRVRICDANKALNVSSQTPEYPIWCPSLNQVVITDAFLVRMTTMSPITIVYELGQAAASVKSTKGAQLFDTPVEAACASGWLLAKLGFTGDPSQMLQLRAYVTQFIKSHPRVYSDPELFWKMGPATGIAFSQESKPVDTCAAVG